MLQDLEGFRERIYERTGLERGKTKKETKIEKQTRS